MTETPLTDAELVILSLIYEQPMHGYQIEREINDRNMRAWTDLATSSIYYILQRLQEKGFTEKTAGQTSQKGAPRRVYQITPEGEKAWKESTLRALSAPTST